MNIPASPPGAQPELRRTFAICGECAQLRAELATARREREAVQHLLGYLRDVAQGRVRYLDRGVVLSQLQEIDRTVAPSPASTPQKGESA